MNRMGFMLQKNVVPILVLIVFTLSYLFQEKMWALHDLWLLEQSYLWTVLIVAAISFLLAFVLMPFIRRAPINGSVITWIILLFTVGAAGYSYYQFPIFFDEYGNAFQYRKYADIVADRSPPNFISQLFSFSIEPSTGRKTVSNIYGYWSYHYQLPYDEIFKLSGLICGVIFGVSILFLAMHFMKDNVLRIVSVLFCVTAPVTMVFHHHFEIYAPVYASVAFWLVLFVQFLQTRKLTWLFLLSLFSLACTKLHPLCLILIFGSVLAGLVWVKPIKYRLNWKNLFCFVHIPLVLVGLFIYFFVVKDYNDLRYLDGVTDAERLFLPLTSPPAPLHKYNLLSFNHIIDFLNAGLLWSFPSLIILFYGLLLRSKTIKWNSLGILIPLNLAFMLAGILFAVNPLLSMPMDRDLFMFPSLFVMVAAFGVLGQLSTRHMNKWFIPLICVVTVLQLPRIWVDSNQDLLSHKLEITGKHIFKTYHLHSSRVLINALILTGNVDDYMSRKKQILIDLKPYAIVGNDPKYANLLMDDGFYYLRHGNRPQLAITKFNEALTYHPQSKEIRALLNEAYQRLSE